MQNAAGDDAELEPDAQNETDRSVVSNLVSLIEHVQASLRLIELAMVRETSLGGQESAANVIVRGETSSSTMTLAALSWPPSVESMRRKSSHRPPLPAGFQNVDARRQRLYRRLVGVLDRPDVGGYGVLRELAVSLSGGVQHATGTRVDRNSRREARCRAREDEARPAPVEAG